MVTKKLITINEGCKGKPRSMSSHVSSRWYRAPELSLIEKQYDQASDMWSLGCVIYELLHCSLESKEEELKL
jgi:mitogen-activated protein kinase 1/3